VAGGGMVAAGDAAVAAEADGEPRNALDKNRPD
jgi:hypothetical protein